MTPDVSDDAFRAQLRQWLQANLPPDMVQRSRVDVHPSRDDMLGITALLSRVGWSVPHWPVDHGGPGWTARQRQVFEEELVLAGGPSNNIQGVSLVGPVIYTYGTPAQKARHLPAIREGREFWAQGFSEPNAGSDLASLRTRAVRTPGPGGEVYVVNGQKIWTSQAMLADWLFCLVRTDPAAKPQRGISFLLIDLRSPGIQVRPIPSIDEGESLCEVFFDDVQVPLANLVGEEGKGWDYAKFLLGHERVQTAEVPRNKLYLARLKAIAAAERRDGIALADDPVFREQIATIEIDLLGLEAAVQAALDRHDDSALTPSALKVLGCELMQRTLGLQVQALGPYASAYVPHSGHGGGQPAQGPALGAGVTAEFLFRRAATIYGGSTEVQKNIIAKLLFSGDEGPPAPLGVEQGLLRDSALRFVRRARPATRPARDGRPDVAATLLAWQQLAATGFTALGLPEAAGGAGGSAADLAVVCEAFGAGLLDEPFVGLTVRTGQTLAALGLPAGQLAELAGALVAAAPLIALAHEEPGHSLAPQATVARAEGKGHVLNGLKCMVAGGDVAQRFLVSARLAQAEPGGDGVGLFLVDATAPGVHRQLFRTIAGSGLCDLQLDQVHLPASARLDRPGQAAAALAAGLDHALVLSCADAVGTMGEALRITRDYLGTRRQFGSPLSEFQALRHRMAEMLAELTAARALLATGVAALSGPALPRQRLAAACKARIGRAALFVGGQAVQLHGGIGMTEDYVIGRCYKRLLAFEHTLGHHAQHTRRFADLAAAAP